MKKAEFDKWVEETSERFCCDNNVDVFLNEGTSVIIVYNHKSQRVGIARCHPDDEFRQDIGVAIAYARCKGIKVPKISTYKKLSEMKNGDTFYLDGVEHFFVGKSNVSICNRDLYAIIDIKEDTIYRFGDSGKVYEMVE